jgi:hypothetical protein
MVNILYDSDEFCVTAQDFGGDVCFVVFHGALPPNGNPERPFVNLPF